MGFLKVVKNPIQWVWKGSPEVYLGPFQCYLSVIPVSFQCYCSLLVHAIVILEQSSVLQCDFKVFGGCFIILMSCE